MAVSSYKRIYEAPTESGSLAGYYLLLDKSGAASAVKAPVTRFFSQEDAVAAANALPHGATDLSLEQAIAATNRGVILAEVHGASPSASASANVIGIQAAIDAANATYPKSTVDLGHGEYSINAPIVLGAVRLAGVAGTPSVGTVIKATHSSATISVGSGGCLSDICFDGNGVATVGVTTVSAASEFQLRNVYVINCGTGIVISGAGGIAQFDGLVTSVCATAVSLNIASGGSYWFRGCNFWDSTTVFDFVGSEIIQLVVRDSWFEKFMTAFNFSTAGVAGVGANGINIHDNHFVSTLGEGSDSCRIIRSTVTAIDKGMIVHGFNFTGNTMSLPAAKYIVEFDWNTYTGYMSNHFSGVLRDNRVTFGSNTVAWIGSDCTAPGLIEIVFENNTSQGNIVFNDSGNPVLAPGEYNLVELGASASASASVNTTAIKAAIAAASSLTYPATIVLPPGLCAVLPDQLIISASHVTLQGTDSYRSQLYCASAGTVLKIEKNAGADVIYDVNLRDIVIHGGDAATVGIAINNLSELVWRNVGIYNCATGMTIKGQYCGNFHFHDTLIANNTVAGIVYLSNAWPTLHHVFNGGNFYNNTSMVKFAAGCQVYGVTFSDIHFEKWINCFLFEESTTAPTITKMDVIGNSFLNDTAGGTATRIFKFTAADALAPMSVQNIHFDRNHVNTINAAYIAEAALNSGTYNASTIITMWMRDNRWGEEAGVAWLKSNVTSPLHHVVTMESNQTIGGDLPVQDGTAALVLGMGQPHLGYQYANQVRGPLSYGAPIVLTPNSVGPSVLSGTIFKTANTSATSYYLFSGATVGQRIIVLVDDAYTSFDFTSSVLKGNGGADWTAASGDWLEAVWDGTSWRCSIHDCT